MRLSKSSTAAPNSVASGRPRAVADSFNERNRVARPASLTITALLIADDRAGRFLAPSDASRI
jgi:hypothetical protein